MKILSIETSCDETALSVVEVNESTQDPTFDILASSLYSQASKHAEFGGVFPALAKREHARNLVPLLAELDYVQKLGDRSEEIVENTKKEVEDILVREPGLAEALIEFISNHDKPDVDVIAVTSGPGLEPALWVGINFARALSLIWQIPMIPVNHMEGHIVSFLLHKNDTNTNIEELNASFPALAILISGGHTELVLVKNFGDYEVIGQTTDDAIGEAYDKTARLLDLPYPGGPHIANLAQQARGEGVENDWLKLPRPLLHSPDYNFSLSGLKTAVLYAVQKRGDLSDNDKKIVAQEFEQSVVDVLIKKSRKAIEDYNIQSCIVGGGVIANQFIRDNLQILADEQNIPIFFPTQELSTDNATMIAIAGYFTTKHTEPEICPDIVAQGNLSLNK